MERRRFLMLAAAGATLTRKRTATAANFYSTQFVSAQNPISEGGHWVNGKSVGLDWQDVVVTAPGFATFTQPNPSTYDDATAILTGVWGPDQYVRANVRIPAVDPNFPQEIEIRLRSSLSAHTCSGYEVLGGSQIVRWNGPLGDFTVLNDEGPHGQLHDGDIFEANIVGTVITVFINGVQVNRAVDGVFTAGSPGMGFFTRNPSAPQFGFSSFRASDAPLGSNPPPSPPTDVMIR
jgi:hypothetical protein